MMGGEIRIEVPLVREHTLSLDDIAARRLSKLCGEKDRKPSEVLGSALLALENSWKPDANQSAIDELMFALADNTIYSEGNTLLELADLVASSAAYKKIHAGRRTEEE